VPRQLEISKLKDKIKKKVSPAQTTDRMIPSAGCKQIGGIGNNSIGKIKKVNGKLARTGVLPEPDKSVTAKDGALSLLSSIGIGIIDDNASHTTTVLGETKLGASQKMTTTFSLLQKETDETIIPNDKIFDLKSVNRQLLGPELITAIDKFPNPQNNPFYTSDEQFTESAKEKKQLLKKGKNQPNVINIANSIVEIQNILPTRLMLPEFKRALGKET
jgi:hypothetical protein